MLKLTERDLSEDTKAHLATLQAEVNAESSFATKVKRAKALWNSKTNSPAGRIAFQEIKLKLISMCVGVEGCNYCERNEASDVEHILPKGRFPHLAFVWSNYLLACKNCNTGFKGDKMYIFRSLDSNATYQPSRKTEPPANEVAFFHQRFENPIQYMQLSIVDAEFRKDFLYYPIKPFDSKTREYKKVLHTMEILGLNVRPSLIDHRRLEFVNYKNRLQNYVDVKNAQNASTINKLIIIDPEIDETLDFDLEKNRILKAIQKDILTADHPTVWQEMIRQRHLLPAKIQALFAQVPELIAASQRA
jgi:hypothetical protein